MKALLRFANAIDKLNEWIGRGAAWLGLAAVLVCTANALARYALNIGSNAWLELQWYFNSAVFLLIAAYALKRNEHVRIDVIISRLSARAQAWIDILGGLFMLLPACIIIAWFSWPSLANCQPNRSTNWTSTTISPGSWPSKLDAEPKPRRHFRPCVRPLPTRVTRLLFSPGIKTRSTRRSGTLMKAAS